MKLINCVQSIIFIFCSWEDLKLYQMLPRILGPFPPSQELPDSNKEVSNHEEEERGTHDAPNTDF